jgi:hypothetical protein
MTAPMIAMLIVRVLGVAMLNSMNAVFVMELMQLWTVLVFASVLQ